MTVRGIGRANSPKESETSPRAVHLTKLRNVLQNQYIQGEAIDSRGVPDGPLQF